ncbi:MAG: hypothetical protein EAX89_07735 [Candidatus Lokiarchaeota archaeon]|nr:hypothetical protein [Candidatus Lokiarchaeota archaeon]
MNRKSLGILFIIIGIYLLVVNPMLSIFFNQVVPIGFDVVLEPLNYWIEWLMIYGWITIVIAISWLFLILKGKFYIKQH